MNKVALVTGASRGIGRVICHKLAENGYNVVVTAKSVTENENLPGTIFSVNDEIQKNYNVQSMALPLDVRNYDMMQNTVDKIISDFGRIDLLVNNAGALWWKPVLETPVNRYDLINDINVRASFLLSHLCIPHMIKQEFGHIIMHSPPLNDCLTNSIYKNKTGYMISKYGMTMTAMGIAEEFRNKNISANTIWPNTAIDSFATRNNALGNKTMWRKPDIIADAIVKIADEDPSKFYGHQLIDEDYLRSKGVNDFSKYQSVSGCEPPKLIDIFDKI